ncbi:tubulin--tyrosine ligase-like protein 12 [Protopterus annectens]|uniref:tubulin--tyrosine ligase-like protein 12 n=1 Tax=Protopterus annectens TaxID=7888 RepID=UPI001CFAC29A|nr:tubulin--tyrosine ligase-like protein 12 [Protopterus annectens]
MCDCTLFFFSRIFQVFDAGEVFGIMRVDEVDDDEDQIEQKSSNPGNEPVYKVIVTGVNGLQSSDPNSIFLVDHAWTYRVQHARQQLREVPGLLHRMANLVGVEFHGEVPDEDVIDIVMEETWRYNQTYQLSVGSAEQKVPVWYIMDEFGSHIQHSDEPTSCAVPFFHMVDQTAYTIFWPLRDLENGDELTRDYTYGELDPLIRKCMLLPWSYTDLRDINYHVTEPPDDYYKTIFTENQETLPVPKEPLSFPKDKVFKVYTEVEKVQQNLTHPRFVLTENQDEADILFMFSHIKDYRKLSEERPHVMVNQFPCENLVTVKDCLASIARRVGNIEGGPRWLPLTFNLRKELPQFVSCFQHREDRGEDNHWICKPWNLARGLDTHISNKLNCIIRHRESTPKVVCKYVEKPVLFQREDVGMVKFDIRYILLLRSVQPLKLYAYNVFWLRFANRAFSLDCFDDYQKHFTVMNYAEEAPLKQIHYDEFIPLFEKQYPEHRWNDIQVKIFKAINDLFQAATSKPAPFGICNYPLSRAVYAVDLMLKWDTTMEGRNNMEPQILEINFNPDCNRACKYHPSFFNDIFSTLFLDETEDRNVACIV